MKPFGLLLFAFLSASSTIAAGSLVGRSPPSSGYPSSGDPSVTGTGTGTGTTVGSNTTASIVRGDTKCGGSVCIAAVVNDNSTVRYTLTSQREPVGWMAIGFGSTMVGSPMVIMWTNADGTVTLSQRQASSQDEPNVVSSPPRVASVQTGLSVTSGSNQQLVFDIPANTDTTQRIIWAYSSRTPSSSDVNARLAEHSDEGRLTLDLTKTSTTGGTSGNGSGTDSDDVEVLPLTSNQKTLLTHAVVATLGFLVVLPIGALIPRYMRTFNTGWFKFHWIVQFILGGLTAIVGVILGIVGASNAGARHLNSPHKRIGIVLLALYLIQVSLGAIIHFIKPKSGRRPPQNYIHAILGIAIIALSLYQVRTGYRAEWPESIGRPAASGINILWYVWAVLLPVAYAGGLAFLPKQLKQEKKSRRGVDGHKLASMNSTPYPFQTSGEYSR